MASTPRWSLATARSPTACTATARRYSPRSTTTAARGPGCTRALRSGRRPRLPTRCPARCPRRSKSTRSPRSSPAYATVAAHCAEGGFDGVELQCSGSSIVRGFLSPVTNLRTDGYGGSLERRARLLLEILSEVRGAVGRKLAVGVQAVRRRARRPGDDDHRRRRRRADGGGTGLRRLPEHLDRRHDGDASRTSTRRGTSRPGTRASSPRRSAKRSRSRSSAPAATGTRPRPSVRCGQVTATSSGWCGPRSPTREFAHKALSGRTESIHLCSACTQECVGRVRRNCCAEVHREPPGRTGGGDRAPSGGHCRSRAGGSWSRAPVPAGLQAAIAAASGGHEVIVFEKAAEPGGQVRLAATAPGRRRAPRSRAQPGGPMPRARCRDPARRPRPRRPPSSRERPDVVIVATGSRPRRPRWACDPPVGSPRLADVIEVLDGSARPVRHGARRRRARVPPGDRVSASCWPLRDVRSRSPRRPWSWEVISRSRGISTASTCARRHGTIAQSTDLVVMALEPGGVQLLHHPTGAIEQRLVDWVVLAVAPASEDRLYRQLRDEAPRLDVRRVGDCVAPRRAHAAVIEGERAGSGL